MICRLNFSGEEVMIALLGQIVTLNFGTNKWIRRYGMDIARAFGLCQQAVAPGNLSKPD